MFGQQQQQVPWMDWASQYQQQMPSSQNMDYSRFGGASDTALSAGKAFGAVDPNAGGGGIGGWLGKSGNLGAAVNGFSALAGAYMGYQQLRQAKEGLRFQREAFNANLANSIKSYNTALEDRIRGRTSNYEGKEADVERDLARHSLVRETNQKRK